MARLWFSGPRMGFIRPGISFGLGPRRKPPRQQFSSSGQHVYVIEGSHGAVKIGISCDPESRRATLQTGAPHHLFLAFSIWAGDAAFDVEQEAHAILAAYRMPGEWFAVSKEMATAAVYGAADRIGVSLGEPPEVNPPREINVTLWIIVLLFASGLLMKAFHINP